jgi:hypothetical protein
MARRVDITRVTGTRINLCDAASLWQRGTNENTNGLLRQYFPKSTNLSIHSPHDLAHVENELNRRPRIMLKDRAPVDLFATLLASQNHPPLRRLLEYKPSQSPHFRALPTRARQLDLMLLVARSNESSGGRDRFCRRFPSQTS